jgi:LmbE family N-acetylglucosaminyl deacetylase
MQATLRKAVGVARWTGLLGRRASLGRHVVVVSPHLDDGVFSLGAAIACATRKGAEVTVLTVLAGDPGSPTPAGPWDARAGFATAGEAAVARRVEDEQACELLRARPVWLPFSDQQYARGGSATEVRAAVVESVGDAQVVLPGFPLLHNDHAWLRNVLDGAFPAAQASLYTEQPYAAQWSEEPGLDGAGPRDGVPPPAAWRRVGAALPDQLRKIKACRAYRSQLPLIGDGVVAAILRYELRVGGEAIAPLGPTT